MVEGPGNGQGEAVGPGVPVPQGVGDPEGLGLAMVPTARGHQEQAQFSFFPHFLVYRSSLSLLQSLKPPLPILQGRRWAHNGSPGTFEL